MSPRRRGVSIFRQVAEIAKADFLAGRNTRSIKRNGTHLPIYKSGSTHVLLKRLDHLKWAIKLQDWLMQKKAKTFVVEPFKWHIFEGSEFKLGIQEYFNRPTIKQLISYFDMKKTKFRQREFTDEEVKLCETFLSERGHSTITLDKLKETFTEAVSLTANNPTPFTIKRSNIIVHGVSLDGKLKISVIDV